MERFLAESVTMKQVSGPVDFNDAAVVGGRVNARGARRITFLVSLAAGTATAAHAFTLKQHDAASAGNSFDLLSDNPYYHKIGAATVFTKVEPVAPVATVDLHTALANNVAQIMFEVLPEQLRADCGWVSLNITDSGGAQLGSVVALVDGSFKPAYINVV